MRVFILLISVFFLQQLSSQEITSESKQDYLKDIQFLEQKAAAKKMNYKKNVNTENYDLKYHRLEWNVDPGVANISGSVTSYFEAKENMTTITFDLANNMTVQEVLQRGSNLSFVQNANEEVVITLPTTLNMGVLDSLTISYSGNPVSSGFGSFEVSTHGNANTPILWTLSEPYGAKGWWPCKQDLIDKIDSIDVYVTHPSQYKTASNGLLISETVGSVNTITRWKHKHPIPAYLIAIAVTDYSVYNNHVTNGNFDVVNYVYPENLSYAQSSTNITPAIIDLYGTLFEMYPFADEKYGHAQFGWGGGMEHTTMTFMGGFGRSLIAHELAHQWFGDKITCGSWEDIWLNEGFATYLDGLVVENFDGNAAFKNWRNSKVNSSWSAITAQPSGSVFVTDTTSVGRIFSSRLSYSKGAMLLHMLRYKLGDIAFFQGIKNYLADPALAFGYAKTANLKQHLEAQSGTNLTEFFNDWFIGEGYPSFSASWNQNDGVNLAIRISQTQSDASVSFFETPLPIRVHGTNGEVEMLRLELTNNNQLFNQSVTFDVASIEIDPDFELISANNNTVLDTTMATFSSDINIYPNPVKDVVNIESTNSIDIKSVYIVNSIGQVVKKRLNKSSNIISKAVINLEGLKSGIYILIITTNDGVMRKKIIID